MQIAMIKDKLIPLQKVDPAYMDRGIFFGDGVYEVLRSYNGRIFSLQEHLDRFSASLAAIEITQIDIEDLKDKVIKAFEYASIENAKIYFHVTRGSEIRNHTGSSDLKPNFFLTVTELKDSNADKEKGIAVSTHPDWRWKRCDIKSLNLLANVLARRDAERKGCHEAILVNEQNQITEGAGSAFFAVDASQKKLFTRPLGKEILPSITRHHVIKIAQNTGLTVTEKIIKPQDAKNADELFIAVTTMDVMGVVQFDGARIADGKVGTHTQKLMEAFTKIV